MDIVVAAEALQQSNYASFAIATAVMYDYVFTLPSEIEYIWNKPWTHVSTLFILIRYLGCCCALVTPFYRGTTLVSGNACVTVYACLHAGSLQCSNRCYALYTLTQFAFLLFLAATDMVMILRVWAMYNGSKLILSLLLMVYIPEFILTAVVVAIASTPQNTTVVTVLNRTFCHQSSALYRWIENALIPLIPAGVTCILVIVQYVRQSLQTHRATRQWQLNQYMNLLSRESVIYFLAILLFGVVILQSHAISFESGAWYELLSVVSCVPLFTLAPRFIVNVRVLYARDLQRRGSCGMDSAFGFSELSSWCVGSTIAPTDVEYGRDEEARRGEETQIAEVDEDVYGVVEMARLPYGGDRQHV